MRNREFLTRQKSGRHTCPNPNGYYDGIYSRECLKCQQILADLLGDKLGVCKKQLNHHEKWYKCEMMM